MSDLSPLCAQERTSQKVKHCYRRNGPKCDNPSFARGGRSSFCTLLKLSQGHAAFHLLNRPEAEDHTFYASHMVWEAELCRPNQRRSSSRSRKERPLMAQSGRPSMFPGLIFWPAAVVQLHNLRLQKSLSRVFGQNSGEAAE